MEFNDLQKYARQLENTTGLITDILNGLRREENRGVYMYVGYFRKCQQHIMLGPKTRKRTLRDVITRRGGLYPPIATQHAP